MGHDLDAYAELKAERDFALMKWKHFEQLAQKLQDQLSELSEQFAWRNPGLDRPDARCLGAVVNDQGVLTTELLSFALGPVWKYDESGDLIDDELVTHWMPLPEPPK